MGIESVPVIGIENVPVRRLPREEKRPERGGGPGVRGAARRGGGGSAGFGLRGRQRARLGEDGGEVAGGLVGEGDSR